MRERFSAAPRLGPRPVGGLGQGSGVLQDTAPSPSVHLLIQGSFSYLNPHLLPHSPPDDHHSINLPNSSSRWGGPYCSSNQWLRGTNGCSLTIGLPRGFSGKESACNAGDPHLIPALGSSLEKGMTTQSSILAWEIPWTEEPGGLQFMRSRRVRHD